MNIVKSILATAASIGQGHGNRLTEKKPNRAPSIDAIPHELNPFGGGRPALSTSPKDYFRNGKHLNQRQLRKKVRAHSCHTSPNKARRARAFKGYRLGHTKKA